MRNPGAAVPHCASAPSGLRVIQNDFPLGRARPPLGHVAARTHMIGRPKLVLASGSPRRLALINQAGIEPEALRPADLDETPLRGAPPRAWATRLGTAQGD